MTTFDTLTENSVAILVEKLYASACVVHTHVCNNSYVIISCFTRWCDVRDWVDSWGVERQIGFGIVAVVWKTGRMA